MKLVDYTLEIYKSIHDIDLIVIDLARTSFFIETDISFFSEMFDMFPLLSYFCLSERRFFVEFPSYWICLLDGTF